MAACGLTEVAGLAGSESLAWLTSLYQAVSYLGFALPFLLALSTHVLPVGVPLRVVAVLAAGPLFVTLRRGART